MFAMAKYFNARLSSHPTHSWWGVREGLFFTFSEGKCLPSTHFLIFKTDFLPSIRERKKRPSAFCYINQRYEATKVRETPRENTFFRQAYLHCRVKVGRISFEQVAMRSYWVLEGRICHLAGSTARRARGNETNASVVIRGETLEKGDRNPESGAYRQPQQQKESTKRITVIECNFFWNNTKTLQYYCFFK